ncbi:MAG TPA: TonB-dependent receptor [Candidatus Omnitrophica bacterium]|nr:TonB-dependent receptor [Candidatus Omnitrophota bacterium]
MWYKVRFYLAVISLSFSLAQISLAEENKDVKFNLGKVTVTATKTERVAKDVSSSVSVISREDIEKSNAKNVAEILSSVSGAYLYHPYGTPVEGKMSLRGFSPYGSERVLILVNGVPLNSGNDNYVQFTKFPSLEDIERIEVVKGPSSALWGGCAMGGVINIITKKAPAKPTYAIQTEFGNYGERNYRAEVGGGLEKFYYRISTGYREGDGYRDNTEYTRRTLSGSLGYNPDESQKFILDFDVQDSHTAYAGSLTETQYKENPKQATSPSSGYLDSSRVALHYKKKINEFNSIEALLFTTDYGYDYPGSYRYLADIDAIGGEARYKLDYPIWDMKSSFLAGLSLKFDDVDYAYYYKTTQKINEHDENLFWSLFFQEEITPLEPLTFTFGGRYDKAEYDAYRHIHYIHGDGTTASKIFDKFSPKFGALYRLTKDINVFVNIGKAFNPPSSYRISTSKYANPDLGPEEATNYELGLKGLFFDRLSLQLSGYWMNVKDEIVSEYVGGATGYKYYNAGKTRHKGIEVETNFWIGEGLTAFFNANFQEAEFKDYKVSATEVYDGKRLPYTPKRTFAWGLKYEHPIGITYSISANYRSDAYSDNANTYIIPSRIIWDTRLDYDCEFKGVDVGFYIGMRNLFDKKYYEYMTSSGKIYPAYPRNYIIGFKIRKEF